MLNGRINVIGAGYWGINLVRNFHALKVLASVCDISPSTLTSIQKKFPAILVEPEVDKLFLQKDMQALVISTPAVTHFELAKKALEHHKDVFVEKPLALKYSEALQLVELAKGNNLILMVGHLLQYHPGMLKLKDLVSNGELGTIEYIYSNRLNLGKIRREENALWSFAPHDISIMLWLLESMPIQVNAVGGNYLQPNVADTTISTFLFDNGVRGHIYVSWLHPFKEQRLIVVGSRKMASFNDMAPPGHKLILYDKKVSVINGNLVAEKAEGVTIPFDEETEPLRAECEHFIHCIETRSKPRTDGEEGLRVLKVLQCCQRSLQMNGQPVQVMEYHD